MILENEHKIHFKNLDALRAFAALAVVFSHFPGWLDFPETSFYIKLEKIFKFGHDGGTLGVIFFFILSGFLITYLLFLEQKKNGKINILHFYMRRILRIWPLYFLTIIVGFVVYPLLLNSAGYSVHENANPVYYVFFAANFDHIYGAFPVVGILGVQWSVCVEEQFYLIWPLLFYFFSRSKLFPLFLSLIIVFSAFFFVHFMYGRSGGSYHLLSCFKYLSLGAFLAWISFFHLQKLQAILNRLNATVILFIYILALAVIIFQSQIEMLLPAYKKWSDVLPAFFFVFVLAEQNFCNHSWFKFGSLKLMSWLGKISYGIYLTHMIAIYISIHTLPHETTWIPFKIILTLGLTILISYLSYRYVESYFLKWKHLFA